MLEDFQAQFDEYERLITALESELLPLVERLTVMTGVREDDLAELIGKARESLLGNRKVVLAVIGQVKTGKSTLLNSLLFEGRSQLPTAATPMTARLTIIRENGEGELPGADIFFYAPEDWKEICEKAARERQDARVERIYADTVAAAERKLGAEIPRLLGTRRTVSLAELDDYVGESGRFTDLVKYTDLRFPGMPLAELKVVDTPGLNDPVRSREQQTLEFLKEADAVLFLSSPHRFLDREDMQLVLRDMVRSGLQEVLVIVPQFDTLDADQKKDFIDNCIGEMSRRATNFARESGFGPMAQDLAARVFVPENTVMVSAMADILARRLRQNERLSQDERWILNDLMKKNGWPVDNPELLQSASNMAALAEKVETRIIARKGQILLSGPVQKVAARINELAAQNQRRLAETQEDIQKIRLKVEERKQEKEAELRDFESFNEQAEQRLVRFARRVQTDDDWLESRMIPPQVNAVPWFSRDDEEAALAEEISLTASEVLRQKSNELRRHYKSMLQELQESLEELMPSLGSQNALVREINTLLSSLFGTLGSILDNTEINVNVRFSYSFVDRLLGGAANIARGDVTRACKRAEVKVSEALRVMQTECNRSLLECLERLKGRMQSLRGEKQRKLDELERCIVEGEAARERLEKKYEQQHDLFLELKQVIDKIEPWFDELKKRMVGRAT